MCVILIYDILRTMLFVTSKPRLAKRARRWLKILLPILIMPVVVPSAALGSSFQYTMPVGEAQDSAAHLEWGAMYLRWQAERESGHNCYVEHRDCPRDLAGLRVVLRHAAGASQFGQFRLINLFVNQRRWVAEETIDDAEDGSASDIDRWQTVGEFFRNGGDCEDFVIAKYLLLRELGITAQDMRLVATLDSVSGLGHALLAIRIDGAVYLADSDNTVYRTHQRHPYEFIYSINEHGIWVHQNELIHTVTTSETRREQ